MLITKRQAIMLRATVREHIRTGTPVGSEGLVERLHLLVSPATVRAELAVLESAGFLCHPHTSAGRVPTTTGYRYYVDHCVTHTPHPAAVARLRTLERTTADADAQQLVKALARALARLSGALAVVATHDTLIREAGLGNLFRTPEFAVPDADDVERLLETLEDRVNEISGSAETGPMVFINGENPWVHTRRISMVVAAPVRASGEPMVATLIGPVRMPYERNVSVMEALFETFQGPRDSEE